MSTSIKQNNDGSASFVNNTDSKELLRIGGDGSTKYRSPKQLSVPFTGGTDTGGGVLSLANPEGAAVIVDRIVLDTSVVATGACTVSAGIAAGATTSAANLIDTLDVNAALLTADNITDKGTNGKSRQKWSATQFLTISKASGASAGLVGIAYISYTLI
jgi:hypothetical protein